MRRALAALATVAIAVAGCQMVESLDGPQRLVNDLQARGLPAALGTAFGPGPLIFDGAGMSVCVGAESVSAYTFEDADAALEASQTVNVRDPWNVGNAVVEWIGPPRFWLRDRVIVVYVGDDEAVDAALRQILGRPFAASANGDRGLPRFDPKPCS